MTAAIATSEGGKHHIKSMRLLVDGQEMRPDPVISAEGPPASQRDWKRESLGSSDKDFLRHDGRGGHRAAEAQPGRAKDF